MELEVRTADSVARHTADLLFGGYVEVLDDAGQVLAKCSFAERPFDDPEGGAIAARPLPPAIALRDGRPSAFRAFNAASQQVLSGTAGYKDDTPAPEMKFKTRQIVEGADVLIESFVLAVGA